MSRIEIELLVHAPIERVFDLARSVDVHLATTPGTDEQAISGAGLLGMNDEVTWRARHFGVMQELTSRITVYDPPRHFRDTMVRGAFRRFDHDHFFVAEGQSTRCRDVFDFTAPLGPLGRMAEWIFLERYMRRFLETRLRMMKELAEKNEESRKNA